MNQDPTSSAHRAPALPSDYNSIALSFTAFIIIQASSLTIFRTNKVALYVLGGIFLALILLSIGVRVCGYHKSSGKWWQRQSCCDKRVIGIFALVNAAEFPALIEYMKLVGILTRPAATNVWIVWTYFSYTIFMTCYGIYNVCEIFHCLLTAANSIDIYGR